MRNIMWKGPAFSPSGYGSANRDYIELLHNAGLNITVKARQNDAQPIEVFGKQGNLVRSLVNKDIDYDIVVHHHVPYENITKGEEEKINIGYNTWETNKLPKKWAETINNNFDMQLVPSEFNKEVYTNSGVKIPVKVLPHCVSVDEFKNQEESESKNYNLNQIPELKNKFKFLSVFQWTERKNPIGLLKAYFSEFYKRDDVVLILKTYRMGTKIDQQKRIKNEIFELKKDMSLDHYPQIYFIGGMLNRTEMIDLYNFSDCFVLPTRAEGFGLPFAEAMAGKCVCIAPNYSGHLDFMKDVNEKCVFLTKFQMTPVAHMNWIPNYDSTQDWAEPDIKDTGFFMRYVCDALDKNQLKNRKQISREHIAKTINPQIISDKFKNIIRNLK